MRIQDEINRLNRNPNLSEFFQYELEKLISYGIYHNDIQGLSTSIVKSLVAVSYTHLTLPTICSV